MWYWYLLTFFGGAFVGFTIAALLTVSKDEE